MITPAMLSIVVVMTLGFAYQGESSKREINTAKWWTSFNKKGASYCKDTYLMKGLWRSKCDKLYCLEEASCYKNANVYATGAVVKADWLICLDRSHGGWCTCVDGSYLTGFYRSSGQSLGNLEAGYCRNVKNSIKWGTCYKENVRTRFDKKGLSQCRKHGYFMVGLWKTKNCDGLHCLETFKCCQPAFNYYWNGGAAWEHNSANWWRSFNKKGASYCKDTYLMRGLKRSKCDKLFCLEEASCDKNANVYATGAAIRADWLLCLDRTHGGWCTCVDGSYLTGFYRSSGQSLGNLEAGYCRNVNDSKQWGLCYEENVRTSFDKIGVSKCKKDGYFMVALWKTKNCDGLHCIETYKCCTPAYTYAHSIGTNGIIPI